MQFSLVVFAYHVQSPGFDPQHHINQAQKVKEGDQKFKVIWVSSQPGLQETLSQYSKQNKRKGYQELIKYFSNLIALSLLYLHFLEKVFKFKGFSSFFSPLKNWDLLRTQAGGVFTAPSKFWPLLSLFALTREIFHMVRELVFVLNPILTLPSPHIPSQRHWFYMDGS